MDVVELAPGGTIELYNANGNVDVIVDVIADVLGYFTTATMTWTDAVPSNPSAPPPAGLNQGPIGMVYDPATNQDIVLDIMTTTSQVTTWAWNGSSWAQQPTAHSPSFFGDFSSPSNLAYDAATGTVVFVDLDEQAYFYVDTTWTWNGTDWNQQFPANEPNSVGNLAYDAATKTVVLDDGSTWNWDGTNWTKSATTTTPVTNGESMAYDPRRPRSSTSAARCRATPRANAPTPMGPGPGTAPRGPRCRSRRALPGGMAPRWRSTLISDRRARWSSSGATTATP